MQQNGEAYGWKYEQLREGAEQNGAFWSTLYFLFDVEICDCVRMFIYLNCFYADALFTSWSLKTSNVTTFCNEANIFTR